MGTIGNAWLHIRRSPYQALAAVSVMMLTFLVGGIFLLLSVGSERLLNYFEQKPQILVFFKDTKKTEDVKKLEETLKQNEKVASVNFVSKTEAFEENKKNYKNNPLVLEMVPTDILPTSLEVSAKKIEYLPELAQLLKKESDIEEFVFPEDVVQLLITWTTTIRTIGLLVVIFLGATSMLTVMTVISMKIALKREEIEILKLVGASPGYIRMPFLVEGMTYGFLGALIGWGINSGILYFETPLLQSVFSGVPLLPAPPLFYLEFAVGMLAVGVGLGFMASLIAIGRYLR